jgi:hypothetical protein
MSVMRAALVLFLGVGACAPVTDLGADEWSTVWDRRSVEFAVGEVLLIETIYEERAVVQFTRVGETSSYRWRYSGKSGTTAAGNGQSVEKYATSGTPANTLLTPLPGHDMTIRAGRVRADWVRTRAGAGRLSYLPRQAKVSVLPAESFNRAL